MNIKQIHIINYKNHQNFNITFDKKIVCFVGENGIGKTNILDAIYFSCIGKSYFTRSDKNCVKIDESFFRIQTKFEEKEMIITYERSKKKKMVFDDIPVLKLSNYMGVNPIVIIAPDDNAMILGNSDERRRFFDSSLSQTDKKYFESLQYYNKIIGQRNALLKNSKDQVLDLNLLNVYNENLIPVANYIFNRRKEFIEEINPFFKESYFFISNEKETPTLEYKSQLLEFSVEDLLKQSLGKDRILRRTTTGIHKDDLEFLINQNVLKTFGSQGQQKTFLLALKLAQHNYLKEKLEKPVFFIIDDIFDKIDSQRSKNLIKFVADHLGQVFISYTNKNVLEDKFKNIDYQLIEINE